MNILVTGANGYIGYPLTYELTEQTNHTIIGIDNNSRDVWVSKIVGQKGNADYKKSISNYDKFIEITGDLTDRVFVGEILSIHKPDLIIHLASQPSMPYSHINGERALFTQINNVSMWVNLLWGITEHGIRPRFILTTTTGVPGQAYKRIPEAPCLNMAGSFYHTSRGFDSANAGLAAKMFDLSILELRTAIVYGLRTHSMREYQQARFDTDTYFGTAINRFVKQAVVGEELTVYGKGLQTKPFISLNDTVQSIINAVEWDFPKGHTILNQTTEMVSIKKLADIISKKTKCGVTHVPNPRKENETHKMVFDNKGFLKLLNKKPDKIETTVEEMIDILSFKEYDNVVGSLKTDDKVSYQEDFG